MEEVSARFDAGRGVDGVRNQEDQCRDHAERLRLDHETVGEELGDGDGVAVCDGELSQARRLEDPAEGVSDGKSDWNPELSHSLCVNRGRQSHENPGAHVGCAGGESRNPGTHLAVAKEVCLFAAIAVAQEEIDANCHHEQQVGDEYRNFLEFTCE